MSFAQLRAMRRSGYRPDSVTVVVGKPRAADDGADFVVVDRPGLDLRPLVGLPVHVVDVQRDPDFLLSTVAELQELGAILLGATTRNGSVGVSPEHELAMRRYRESLCATT